MSLAIVNARASVGIGAPPVTVEVHLTNGLPGLAIVGLPEAAVRESKDRVRGALLSSRFDYPARRITVNLAPADMPKDGGRFDLPIAIGILAASGQLPAEPLANLEFVGELALSGALRPVRGALAASLAARDSERAIVVAEENGAEAAFVPGAQVHAAGHLLTVTAHLAVRAPLEPVTSARPTRCTYWAGPGGTEQSNVALRSPMSIPISRVGVHESRFGYHGLRSFTLALKWSSSSSRSSRDKRPLCSALNTRSTSPAA